MGDLKVSGSLGCSAPEMVELRMRRGGSRAKSQDHSPGFQEDRLPPRPRPQLCSLLWPGPALGTSWWQQGDGRRRGKSGVGRHALVVAGVWDSIARKTQGHPSPQPALPPDPEESGSPSSSCAPLAPARPLALRPGGQRVGKPHVCQRRQPLDEQTSPLTPPALPESPYPSQLLGAQGDGTRPRWEGREISRPLGRTLQYRSAWSWPLEQMRNPLAITLLVQMPLEMQISTPCLAVGSH